MGPWLAKVESQAGAELARGLPKPLRDELWAQSRSPEADFTLGCCLCWVGPGMQAVSCVLVSFVP